MLLEGFLECGGDLLFVHAVLEHLGREVDDVGTARILRDVQGDGTAVHDIPHGIALLCRADAHARLDAEGMQDVALAKG